MNKNNNIVKKIIAVVLLVIGSNVITYYLSRLTTTNWYENYINTCLYPYGTYQLRTDTTHKILLIYSMGNDKSMMQIIISNRSNGRRSAHILPCEVKLYNGSLYLVNISDGDLQKGKRYCWEQWGNYYIKQGDTVWIEGLIYEKYDSNMHSYNIYMRKIYMQYDYSFWLSFFNKYAKY